METPIWRRLDFILLATDLVLLGYGVLMVYGATFDPSPPAFNLQSLWVRQALFGVVGLLLMVILARIDYRYLDIFTVPIYLVGLAALVVTLAIGNEVYGARRWITLGFYDLQPSEFVKVLLILALARFFSGKEGKIGLFRHYLPSMLLVVAPFLLVFRQPDLGTSLVYLAIWVGMVLMARPRPLYLIGTVVIGLPILGLVWRFLIKDFQRGRILTFLNPEADLLGAGYNVIQAKISIGAGGFLGQGLGNATQTQLRFLPVQHTDFIFASVAETFGFVGALALFALYLMVLWRGLTIATRARDSYGTLLAVGVVTMIFFQVVVNVGMNLGVMPVTGITLPFVSAGGSSLITVLATQGLLQSVWNRQKGTSPGIRAF